jgi:uncharacterized protein
VLSRPEFQIRKGLRQQLLDLIKKRAHLVNPVRAVEVTNDPGGNVFVACADAALADYLMTGTLGHFPSFWKNTKVVISREFLNPVAPHFVSKT